MTRKTRKFGITGWEHIIIRGINRENLFYDDEDYTRMITTIKKYQSECNFELAVLCLMSNHVHFLLGNNEKNHAQIMKKITVSYANYYNKKYDRVGHVFQDRFKSEPVEDSRYLLTVARYIYQNPAKAGICSPEKYKHTLLDQAGILSRYFTSGEKMIEYLMTPNDDKCEEFDSKNKIKDSEAVELIFSITGNRNPQFLQQLSKSSRNDYIRKMKQQGMSIRQISRLTGINRNMIQRA